MIRWVDTILVYFDMEQCYTDAIGKHHNNFASLRPIPLFLKQLKCNLRVCEAHS